MGAHTVVLDLLQIPFEKVSMNRHCRVTYLVTNCLTVTPVASLLIVLSQSDDKMNEIMTLAHAFLQNFCRGNQQNQFLLHKHLNLFLTPGVGMIGIVFEKALQ